MATSVAPFSKPLRAKGRRSRHRCLPVPAIGILLGIGLFAILGFSYTALRRHDADYHTFKVQRRSLQVQPTQGAAALAKPQEDPFVPIPGYRHTLLVLTGAGPGGSPAWDANALEKEAGEVVEPLGITWYRGAEAASLGSWFGVEKLPAVVYIHPHCMPASCGAPPVLEVRTDAGSSGGSAVGTRAVATKPTSARDIAMWLTRTGRHPILLANDHTKTAYRFRHVRDVNNPDNGRPLGEFVLEPAGRQWIETPLGADWVVTPVVAKDAPAPKPVIIHRVKGDTHLIVRRPEDCNFFRDAGCKLPLPHIEMTPRLLRDREANFGKLLKDIHEQKTWIPRYTKAGFKKTRAPPLLYALLKEFFEKHKNNSVIENWTDDNIYVNHEQSRFLLVDLPEIGSMKPTIFELIRPVFEEWVGNIPLVPSAIYGVRIYTEGSILQDHADRPDTHQVSAIINVDQDVGEPWPLDVFGHSGKLTKVLMKPGDMVLYEGASCAHGRPQPLVGRFMANVFLHMRPRVKQPNYSGPVTVPGSDDP